MSDGEEDFDDTVVEEEGGGGSDGGSGGGSRRGSGGGYGGGGAGDSDVGPLNPCCACSLGLVLLVVSVIGLWMNEGSFVHTIQALDALNNRFVTPCSDDCSSCNFNSVEDPKTGRTRPLKTGDEVYMGCSVQGLKDLGESLTEKFPAHELTGALRGADAQEKAASFTWGIEMFQDVVESGSASIPNLTTFQRGKYKNDAAGYCSYKRKMMCDQSKPMPSWVQSGPGPVPPPISPPTTTTAAATTTTAQATTTTAQATTTTAQATTTTAQATTTTAHAPAPVNECKELNKDACTQKADKCTWDWRCPKIKAEDECRKLGPVECQWAAETITVKGKECKGCCTTESTWKVACKPKTKSEEVAQKLEAWSFQELDGEAGEDQEVEEKEQEERKVELRSLRGNRSVASARRLKGSKQCKWEHCKFTRKFMSIIESTPATWPALPVRTSGPIQYVRQPAYNLQDLSAGESREQVWLGARGSSADEGVGLDKIFAEAFPAKMLTSVRLKAHAGAAVLTSKEVKTTYTLKADPSQHVDMVELDRSGASSAWTADNSRVERSCIYSSSGKSQPVSGDLRACFSRSTTSRISAIGSVQKDADGRWQLVASPDPKVGLLMRLNEIVSAEDLIEHERSKANAFLKALRIMLPLMMWLGFFCCLSPLVWVIDKFGDAFESIPCVGGLLGGMVDIVETLAECAICMVSCCGAMACSLLVGSIAWVFFRPLVGVPLLIVSVALFAGLAYFGSTRKGEPKVRRRPSAAAREVQVSGVEMGTPVAAVAQPVQFAVVCPEGVCPGGMVQCQAPDGRMVQVQVPDGVEPGQQFMVAA